MQTDTPPPGAVHELAERAVDFVRRSLALDLDYTLETLPLLDHYLSQVPPPDEQPDTAVLVATCAGAYFGEVVRRTLGGWWLDDPKLPAHEWRLELSGGVKFCPGGMALEAIAEADLEDADAEIDVPRAAREAVQAALEARGAVPEDEYYSLSGRLETLELVVDVAVAAQAPAPAEAPAEPDED